MQCVILAAGEGTRMRPRTLERPKPLIAVAGVPLIDHIVRALPPEVTEIVMVVGYKGEMLRAHCGATFYGRTVRYVEQENPKGGTGAALMLAKPLIRDTFLLMYADDIHGASALAEAVRHRHALLVARAEHPERFGVVVCRADGSLETIIEKPSDPPSDVVSVGGFVFSPDIFTYLDMHAGEREGEYYLTDAIPDYAAAHRVAVIEQDLWIPVGYPQDIQTAEAILAK